MTKDSKVHYSVLSVLFLLLSLILFLNFGVKNVNDSHRYLDYATNLQANGFYFDRHNFWYIGYSLFIYLIRLTTGSSNEINLIISQVILSYFSLLLLYRASHNLSGSSGVAFTTALLYLIFVEILSWNFYILCESFYLSLTCFSLYFLSKYFQGDKSIVTILVGGLVFLLTFFTKPTGVALAAAILGLILIRFYRSISKPIIKYALGGVSALLLLILINKMLETFLVMENYSIGEVVYAISTLPYKVEYASLFVTVPTNLDFPPSMYPPLGKILYFITFNPTYWIKLFFAKVFFFLFHVRPFWSFEHNLFSLMILLPVYFYSIKSLIASATIKSVRVFSIMYLTIHTLSIGITTVDWDGRFLMPLLPLLFLLSASGIANDVNRLFRQATRGLRKNIPA